MATVRLSADTGDAGVRADSFLAGAGAGLTRSAAQRLLEAGLVLRRGAPLRKNDKIAAGDEIILSLPAPTPAKAAPQAIPLDVIYEDGDVIAVNKPAGMVVHPAPGHPDGTLVNALLAHCGDSLSGIGGELRPGIVHRIDRDTSGLILAAKHDMAHRALAAQLKNHSMARVYEAVVIGRLREDKGTIDAAVARHPTQRKRMAAGIPGGRAAVTHWEVLGRYRGFTHVCCRLETGRTHQIRVHMAYIGHPLLGDTVYGARKSAPGLRGQCLHAGALRFLHPRTGAPVELTCPPPEAFSRALAQLPREE